MPIFVFSNICLFEPREVQKFFFIKTGNPARFIKWQGIKNNGSAILMQQTILNYFKLQLSYTPDDLSITSKLREQLSHPFICQLKQSFFQLFCLHRIFIHYFLEYLG